MTDAVTLLERDHRRADALFARFEQTTVPEVRRRLMRRITQELSAHAAVEEMLLYPTVARVLPDGDRLAAHSVDEHQELKDLLAELDGADPVAPDYDGRVRRLITDTRNHVDEEERDLLPRLRDALTPQQLTALGAAMAAAKLVAPRRPHPRAPNQPPGNALAGPLAVVVDGLRDRLPQGSAADRALDALSLSTDTVLQGFQTWVQEAARWVPGMREPAPAPQTLTAEEAVDQAFEAAARLLDAQRELARQLVLAARLQQSDSRARQKGGRVGST